MPINLNPEQQAQLEAMLQQDAANPAPPEEAAAEEEISADEAEQVNENTEAISEGEAEAADQEAVPDPAPAPPEAAPPAAAPALPEGMQNVEQLIQAYNALKAQTDQSGNDMQMLRDMNQQLVSIAEAIGYGKELNGIDLTVDEKLKEKNPEAYMKSQVKAEIATQLKPLLEQQQKNLRGRLIDKAWRDFSASHEDLKDMMDDVKAIMDETKDLYNSEDGLEVAYHLARSRRYAPESKLLESDDFIAKAAKIPKIKEKVIEEYLRQVSKDGENAPVTVGGGGKAIPASLKSEPRTMDEAHEMARKKYWGE